MRIHFLFVTYGNNTKNNFFFKRNLWILIVKQVNLFFIYLTSHIRIEMIMISFWNSHQFLIKNDSIDLIFSSLFVNLQGLEIFLMYYIVNYTCLSLEREIEGK